MRCAALTVGLSRTAAVQHCMICCVHSAVVACGLPAVIQKLTPTQLHGPVVCGPPHATLPLAAGAGACRKVARQGRALSGLQVKQLTVDCACQLAAVNSTQLGMQGPSGCEPSCTEQAQEQARGTCKADGVRVLRLLAQLTAFSRHAHVACGHVRAHDSFALQVEGSIPFSRQPR